MKDGPDIALIAALIGDPARANMLSALMSGKALTATELSQEANITVQTTSSHLSKLTAGGLLSLHKQGRYRYFSLANANVAQVLESLMGLAAKTGHLRTRTGPRNEDLRRARVCYNHLAGNKGIQMYDAFLMRRFLSVTETGLDLTKSGSEFVQSFGVDVDALRRKRSVICRECLDWSERKPHLAGSLGRAMLNQMESLGWLCRVPDSRIIRFTEIGENLFGEQIMVKSGDEL